MNRLHQLISATFLRYFIMITIIMVVLLVMDAFAMHFSGLMESGMDSADLRKLLVLGMAKVFPVVVPLSILASALLTASAFSESHELFAVEGVGISLQKFSLPLVWFSFIAVALSLYGTFYWVPKQNLKLNVLMYELMYNQPEVNIRPGYFWNDVEGISMRVGRREKDSPFLYDILLYQYNPERDANSVIIADSARMYLSPSKKNLTFEFYHGNRQEEYAETNEGLKHYPYGRIYFDTLLYRYPVSYLSPEEVTRKLVDHNSMQRPDLERKLEHLAEEEKEDRQNTGDQQEELEEEMLRQHRRYKYAFAEMHTLPLLNVVFMLLGIGLGSMTRSRSRGVAVPALIAVALFAIFYILKVQGGRLGYKGVIDPWWAAALPILVFLPLSVWIFFRNRR